MKRKSQCFPKGSGRACSGHEPRGKKGNPQTDLEKGKRTNKQRPKKPQAKKQRRQKRNGQERAGQTLKEPKPQEKRLPLQINAKTGA